MKSALHTLTAVWPWTTVDVLNHLWQSTVVGVAVLLMLALSRGLSARTRRALGWMALAKFALPASLFMHAFARLGATPGRWAGAGVLTEPIKLPAFVVTASGGDAVSHLPAGALVAVIWLAGFGGLLAAWIIRGAILRRRIFAEAAPVPAALAKQIAAAAARAGWRGSPRCVMVASERGPGVLGVFSPMVILPRGLEATLAPTELESVLIHEFVHLRRRDNLWSALQAFFVSLFWFHPVVWLLNRRLGIETEQSCDERVLEITGDPDTYAGGIVKAVRHALGVAQPGLVGAVTPPVVTRIKNIFSHGARRDRPLVRGAVLAGGGLLLALSGYTGSFAAQSLTANASAPQAAIAAPAATATPTPSGPVAEPTLSVDFPNEDIRNIINNVAHLFALKVDMPDSVRGKITLKLWDVTWREIFQDVLEPAGYTFVEDGNVVRIVAKETLGGEPATTEVFRLTNARAQDILPSITPLVDPAHGQAVVDARTNSLVITERASRMNRIRPIIEQFDRVPDSQHVAPAGPSPAPAAVAPASPVAPVGPTAPALMAFAATPQPPTQPESSLAPAALTKEVMAIPAGAPMPAPIAATGDVGSVEPPNPGGPTASDLKLRGIRVYDPSQLDQQPVPKSQARPQYPLALRRSGVGGEASVDFIIDTNGDVQNAYAIHSTYREFAISAVAAVSQWKFRPGRKGGQNVATHMQVPIVFTLNEH